MPQVQSLAVVTDVEVAHSALDSAWVEAATAADAAAAGDFVEQRLLPGKQTLRGNSRSLRHLALDRTHGVHEAQCVRGQTARSRLGHQLPYREVRQ